MFHIAGSDCIDIFPVACGKFMCSNTLNARDYVDLGSFYKILIKLVVLELCLNLLSLSLFCLILLCSAKPKALSPWAKIGVIKGGNFEKLISYFLSFCRTKWILWKEWCSLSFSMIYFQALLSPFRLCLTECCLKWSHLGWKSSGFTLCCYCQMFRQI